MTPKRRTEISAEVFACLLQYFSLSGMNLTIISYIYLICFPYTKENDDAMVGKGWSKMYMVSKKILYGRNVTVWSHIYEA